MYQLLVYGELAQLARAPALHAGGHRFDSGILHEAVPRDNDKIVPEHRTDRTDILFISGDSPRSLTYWDGSTADLFCYVEVKEETRSRIEYNKGLRGHLCIYVQVRQAKEGRMGDAWALRGEEGRDKLRKAAGIGTHELIRGCPNGATRQVEGLSPRKGGEPAELKHLSRRRKRKQE